MKLRLIAGEQEVAQIIWDNCVQNIFSLALYFEHFSMKFISHVDFFTGNKIFS